MCGQHGMRSCDSYRARITAIFATAINHPIRSPASSANPHNHAPHGSLDTMGIQDPSFSARARARTPSRTRTRTRTRTRLAQYGTHLRLLHAASLARAAMACHMCRMCRQTLSCCRQSLSYVDKSCHNADKPGHAAKISPKANP